MRSRLIILVELVLLAILVPGSQLSTSPRAQSPTEQRPTLKEFGSSVKRLKWDPVKQAAVESRSAQKQPAADDVIRIDIELVVCDVLILDRQGHAVQGLTQEDFTVAEDGQPQHISHFSLGDEGEVERSKYLLQIIDGWTRCQSAVSKVATITGGFAAFLENPNQAGEIYSRILSDMNSRYVIGYYPTNKTRDGKRRKVLVEVRNHPEYTVEGRKTYYAPGPEQ